MKDIHLYQQILGIGHPWFVERVTLKKEEKEVEVVVGCSETNWACPECHRAMHIHEHKQRRWRHLDTCQFKTIIVANAPRVKCEEHGCQTVKVPWAEDKGRFSALFERFAIDLLLECSISAACDLLRITWAEADGIKQRAVKRGVARKKPESYRDLGIDEKSFGRGHKFVTLVAKIEKGQSTVEFVNDGNRRESLDPFWQCLSQEQKDGIKSVSMDMWRAFEESVIANVPNPGEKIVFDRFHIMKHMNEALNNVRKMETGVLLERGDETLKGTKQIWLYASENLPGKYDLKFEELIRKKLKTGRAWALKETLREFWDCPSVEEGTAFFKAWYNRAIRSRLKPVMKVAKMIKKRLRHILNYFKHRVTNAALEGINNKIQALIKKAYGYRNNERFKTDILFHCGGLDLYPAITQ